MKVQWQVTSGLKLTRNFHSGLLVLVKDVCIPPLGDVQQRVDSDAKCNTLGCSGSHRKDRIFPPSSPPSSACLRRRAHPSSGRRTVYRPARRKRRGRPRSKASANDRRRHGPANAADLPISPKDRAEPRSRLHRQCRRPSRIPDPQTESARDGFVNGLIRKPRICLESSPSGH